jgi:hypothetical protein
MSLIATSVSVCIRNRMCFNENFAANAGAHEENLVAYLREEYQNNGQ